MGKYCLMMPQQKRQRERPKNYTQPFMIILVLLAIVVCGIYQKAFVESREIKSCCAIELSDIPESAGSGLNKMIESPKRHEEALDSLKFLSEAGNKSGNAPSFR